MTRFELTMCRRGRRFWARRGTRGRAGARPINLDPLALFLAGLASEFIGACREQGRLRGVEESNMVEVEDPFDENVIEARIGRFCNGAPRTWQEIVSTLAGVHNAADPDLEPAAAARAHKVGAVLWDMVRLGKAQRACDAHPHLDLYRCPAVRSVSLGSPGGGP